MTCLDQAQRIGNTQLEQGAFSEPTPFVRPGWVRRDNLHTCMPMLMDLCSEYRIGWKLNKSMLPAVPIFPPSVDICQVCVGI